VRLRPPRPTLARISDGTFAAVIRAYQASPAFAALAPGSRKNYASILRLAERADTLGSLSVYTIRPALVQAFLDGLADRPGAQRNAQAVLGAVEKWAIVRDLLAQPIILGTYCVHRDGGHEPWSPAWVRLAQEHAGRNLSKVVTLMAHTGQRGSDVVRMRLTDIEEQDDPITGRAHAGINVVQQKTGRRLWIPMTTELEAAIATWRKDIRPPWLLVTKPGGSPYTRPQLSWHWNDERDRNPHLAPLKAAGAVLHGLRGYCVVELRKRRATDLQISNMIGMSEPMVARYSRLADQREMALAAVHHLNAGAAQTEAEQPASKSFESPRKTCAKLLN
jgi:integrase